MSTEIKTQVVVLGAGPAGYSAAFRCADLGLETVIVERYNTLGGVCLNVGCIPSKALLHVAKVIEEAKALAEHGIVFGEPKTDIDKIRTWKEKVINQLTGGLAGMAKGRKVKVVNGLGKFTGANTLEVEGENGKTVITVLHDLNQACRYCDHLIVMKKGAVMAQGTPDEVMTEELLKDVFDLDVIIHRDPISNTPMFILK